MRVDQSCSCEIKRSTDITAPPQILHRAVLSWYLIQLTPLLRSPASLFGSLLSFICGALFTLVLVVASLVGTQPERIARCISCKREREGRWGPVPPQIYLLYQLTDKYDPDDEALLEAQQQGLLDGVPGPEAAAAGGPVAARCEGRMYVTPHFTLSRHF